MSPDPRPENRVPFQYPPNETLNLTNLLQIIHGQVCDVDGEEAPDVEAERGHGEELSQFGGFSTLGQLVILIP